MKQFKPFFGLILVAVVLFGIFVWPTRYGHVKAQFASREMLVRYERLGWDAWVLTNSGWRQISYEHAAKPMPSLPTGFVLEKP